jgi:MFS family permease
VRSSAYIPLLRIATVRRQAVAGFVSQITQGAAGVGTILVLRQHTGSLALAGAVVGASSIAAGLARPVQGRLIDARGATGVMVVCGIVHPAALIGIVALALGHGPHWLLIALGILAGLALPPISTSMRASWGELDLDGGRTAAYSLVYLVQELSILIGPLILSAVIALASPAAALVVVAALAGLGTLAFAAAIPRVGGAHTAAAPRSRGAVLRAARARVVLLIALLVGGTVGALEVAVPIFATAHHSPASAGLLIAVLSIGGIAGAAIYGSAHWRANPADRLVVLLALMTVCLAPLIGVDDLLGAGLLLLLAGGPLNPALATFSLLLDAYVPLGAAAEAFGWLSTAFAGGTGVASALAAAVAHGRDPRAAFVVAVAAAAGAAVIAAASAMRSHRR